MFPQEFPSGLTTCTSLWLSAFVSPSLTGPHSTCTDPTVFWLWIGRCVGCGERVKALSGIFCANFASCHGSWGPCGECWHPGCYKAHRLNSFHAYPPKDESSCIWVKEGDEDRFQVAWPEDHFSIAFHGDKCIFCMLTDRSWEACQRDGNLRCIIQRMNLDAFWSRELGTVYRNYLNVQENLSIWEMCGIEARKVMPWVGPFLMKDVLGYAIVISMLVKSRRAGRYADYTQFETAQKFCSVMSNLQSTLAEGTMSTMFSGKNF